MQSSTSNQANNANAISSKKSTMQRITTMEGSFYGEMVNGKLCGRGLMKFDGGGIYIGDWQDNLRHGKGLFMWPNGSVYEGDWFNDMLHGKGVQRWQSGHEYEGSWVEDKREGRGIIRWANGDTSEGEWMDNRLKGSGRYTSNELGYVFEGVYEDDCRSHGVMRWLNGDHWVGDCFPDLTCKGVMTIAATGEVVVGEWQNYRSMKEGKGEMKNSKGEIGEWKDGKFVPTITSTK